MPSTRPLDAMHLLWQRLGTSRDEVSFSEVRDEIWATMGEDGWLRTTHDHERDTRDRLAILAMVSDACEAEPKLELDWFAVGAVR